MFADITSVVATLSALVGVASLLVYLYFVRRSDFAAAREEALALAETRRETIRDLRARLESLEERHKRAKAEHERRMRALQAAFDRTRAQARNDAYQTQHFYAAMLSGLLNDLRSDLEATPPDVDAALARIRKVIAGERPAA